MTSTTSGTGIPREQAERTVTVQGIETHLFEAGAPNAPPLLYLHGTSLGNLWLDYHLRLAERFHLFAPDIPGFGLTDRPDWMRDMSDYVLYLRDLLYTLGLERPSIVGHSLGGWMAAEVAVWYPERVGKLVLSNAAGIRVKGSPLANLFAMNPQELFMTVFEDPSAGAPLIPAEVTHEYIIDQFRQRATLASLAWNPHYDPKLERRLERVRCPTLVIWGATDRLIPAVYGERYHELIAGSKLVTLQGTGHMPMFEKPTEWSEAITTFLLEDEAGQHGRSIGI
ncbi:MAG TPA: alpha/beta hydrolase [Ktedonobacterales bacterium]|nr:alpha/beta hydrolase [Ktedonobacterales bacterium]